MLLTNPELDLGSDVDTPLANVATTPRFVRKDTTKLSSRQSISS
jgi:hypothetical protein